MANRPAEHPRLVLDSGGVSRLAERTSQSASLIAALRERDLWPPAVPSIVLVEVLTSQLRNDANTNRFLKTCDVGTALPVPQARRAAALRYRAGRGSAVDAVVIATAEPDGTALSGDLGDLKAMAAYADGVVVERI